MFRRALRLLIAGLTAAPAWAQTPDDPSPNQPRPILSRILDGDLPQLDIPGTFKLLFRPHFGDLVRRDYMRTEAGLRWALDRHFDISGEASVYFNHGLGDTDEGYGIGRARLGSRYLLEGWPRAGYDTSLALTMEAPVGDPPVDMTDGQYHLTPSFIIQRPSVRHPKLTAFAGLGLDLIDPSDIPGQFGTNQPHEDSMNGTIGAIYDLGQLKYVVSATYATTAMLGNNPEHFLYLQPSVQWYVPRKFTFKSKTQWIVGLGVRTSWGPDGTDFSVRNRIRAEITFRQLLRQIRDLNKPSGPAAP
jgi:hypothetical protein